MANQVKDSQHYSLEQHETRVEKRNRKTTSLLLGALLLVLCLVGVWQAWEYLRAPEIESYADETVQLIGVGDETRLITPQSLVDLECQPIKATNVSDRSGQGEAIEKTAYGYGPTLNDVIGQWGYTLGDFDRIVVQCSDGYAVTLLPGSTLEGEVYLSVAKGKDALPEEMQPMRLIMPDMASGQWAYGIESITFEKR